MDNSQRFEHSSEPDETVAQSNSIDPLKVLRLLRSAGGALCSQAGLYGQLARVEWAEEKSRLLKMAVLVITAIACGLCVMLFAGILVLTLSWDTQYRVHAVLAVIAAYALGVMIAWYRLQSLSVLGEQSFAATREEMAADIALVKSKL